MASQVNWLFLMSEWETIDSSNNSIFGLLSFSKSKSRHHGPINKFFASLLMQDWVNARLGWVLIFF